MRYFLRRTRASFASGVSGDLVTMGAEGMGFVAAGTGAVGVAFGALGAPPQVGGVGAAGIGALTADTGAAGLALGALLPQSPTNGE
jgi:hypothetical protein